ncbi:MAG: hypothetical protein ACR2PT_04430 [Endozoicomonas sp.]
MEPGGVGRKGQQQAVTSSLSEADTSRPGILKGQKVTRRTPTINLPRGPGLKGISLERRKVSVPAIKESYFARLKARATGRPTPWQRSKINDLTRNLVASMGEAPGDSTATTTTTTTFYNTRGYKANKQTRDQRAGMILVEVGLAEVRTNKNHQLEFIYKRPHDLKQQIMAAELLFETIPLTPA